MIKRTLYFGNPARISLCLGQLVVATADRDLPVERTIPIEDIGIVILDNKQLTVTSGLIEELLEFNVAVITCDSKHMPSGMMLSLVGHTVQSERIRTQLDASLPLKKALWQQTIQAKISNQAAVLKYVTGQDAKNMLRWAREVKSGDPENLEARAAAHYWKSVFLDNPGFVREQDGVTPNSLLNYGYAILRAIIARALTGSGMLPLIGIHHHNKYDDYCLADDIMEPYRPYVDRLVLDIIERYGPTEELTKEVKVMLLSLPTVDVEINGHTSPLMIAATTTTASLYKCFEGSCRKIVYPSM